MNWLKRHTRIVYTGALVLAALGLGGTELYRSTHSDCCQPGAACCHPGSPCCHHAQR